ncbi:MAG: hypothetical protein HC916_04835 [Coleofasciculaceae cyanobacterium SM2_1_6]|nr:hypothetical protein [Coleofasciculaceae cyanobacterium SM2_1_6]
MKLFQKISAGILISFGLLVTFLAIREIANPQTSQKDKEDFFEVMVFYGWTSGISGAFLVRNVLQTEKKEKESLAAKERERLQSIFYSLLKEHKGELPFLLFAMETKLSPDEARHYLDQKVKEFRGNSEVDNQGEIIYRFNLSKSTCNESP